MARKLRIEFPGALYHLSCRGFRDRAIFRDQAADRELFLHVLGEMCETSRCRVHAYVLMDNHYHLILETPEANLSAAVQWFQAAFTIKFAHRHHHRGKFFGDRYKAIPVDREEPDLIAGLAQYIHLNPVRSGLLSAKQPLTSFSWSSFPSYLTSRGSRPGWLVVDEVLTASGCSDTPAGRRRFASMIEHARRENPGLGGRDDEALSLFRRGWYLGGDDFRKRMLGELTAAAARPRPKARPRPPKKPGEAAAGELLGEGLKYFGLSERDLPKLKKSDRRKRVIGHVIHRVTSVRLAWLGQRLKMGAITWISRYCKSLDDLDKPKRAYADAAAIARAAGWTLPPRPRGSRK